MFIVVEYNQVAGVRVMGDDIYDSQEYAESMAQAFRDELVASGSGRRERYEVWTCEPIDEED